MLCMKVCIQKKRIFMSNILIVEDSKINHEDVMNLAEYHCLPDGVVCAITCPRYKKLWQKRLSVHFVFDRYDYEIPPIATEPMSFIIDHGPTLYVDDQSLLAKSRHKNIKVILIAYALPNYYEVFDFIFLFPETFDQAKRLGFPVVPKNHKLIKISLGGPAYQLSTKDNLPEQPPPRYVNTTYAEKYDLFLKKNVM
jgi:hypothetical protein